MSRRKRDWVADHKPRSLIERDLVEDLVDISWQLDRCKRYQAAILSDRARKARDEFECQSAEEVQALVEGLKDRPRPLRPTAPHLGPGLPLAGREADLAAGRRGRPRLLAAARARAGLPALRPQARRVLPRRLRGGPVRRLPELRVGAHRGRARSTSATSAPPAPRGCPTRTTPTTATRRSRCATATPRRPRSAPTASGSSPSAEIEALLRGEVERLKARAETLEGGRVVVACRRPWTAPPATCRRRGRC